MAGFGTAGVLSTLELAGTGRRLGRIGAYKAASMKFPPINLWSAPRQIIKPGKLNQSERQYRVVSLMTLYALRKQG